MNEFYSFHHRETKKSTPLVPLNPCSNLAFLFPWKVCSEVSEIGCWMWLTDTTFLFHLPELRKSTKGMETDLGNFMLSDIEASCRKSLGQLVSRPELGQRRTVAVDHGTTKQEQMRKKINRRSMVKAIFCCCISWIDLLWKAGMAKITPPCVPRGRYLPSKACI